MSKAGQESKAGCCQTFCGVCYFMFCGTQEEIKAAVELAPPVEYMDETEPAKPPEDDSVETSPVSNDNTVAQTYKADTERQQRLSLSQPNLPVLPRQSFLKNQV
jgi:hypothetical protein